MGKKKQPENKSKSYCELHIGGSKAMSETVDKRWSRSMCYHTNPYRHVMYY